MDDSFLVARFNDAKGRDVIGPVFEPQESECRSCLVLRLHSCGLGPPRFLSADGMSEHLRENLSRTAVFNDADSHVLSTARFRPLPLCCCPRVASTLADPPLDLMAAVDPVFGPIVRIEFHQAPEGHTLAIANGVSLRGTSGAFVAAIGSATDRDDGVAARRAVAEALERYSAGFWDSGRLVQESRGSFVTGFDCISGAPIFVPAAKVFLPFDLNALNEAAGLAAGKTIADATARALAERIERDVARPFFEGLCDAATPLENGQAMLGSESGHEVWLTVRFGEMFPYASIGLGAHRNRAAARNKSSDEAVHVAAHMALVNGALSTRSPDVGWLDSALLQLAFDPESAVRLHSRLTHPKIPPLDITWRRRASVDVTTADVAAFGLRVARVVNVDEIA